MKRLRWSIILASVIISGWLLPSCKKEDSPDFRDKYVGKYQVTETITCYGFCGSCYSERDTVIIVNYGLTDSTLAVLGRDVHLDSSGFGLSYHYGLTMRNDSIWSYFMNGGLGCGQYEDYVGVRISEQP